MTRTVICNVTNKTNYMYYAQPASIKHGKCTYDPQTISANSESTRIFQFEKDTGALYGTTGSVAYKLFDSSILSFYFSCPYGQQGLNGQDNCWFYTQIQPPSASSASAYSITANYLLDDTFFMFPGEFGPSTGGTIVANVTIEMI